MWEVDPDTRSKLLEIQKRSGNNICVDCDAPSPQWASPKFGIFMCLSCSGVHRSLGVHVSFVRSVSMDSFKPAEIARLSEGGNVAWRQFFDDHESNVMAGRSFAECSIAERYDCEAGVEWKDRLAAKVDGKEYVAGGGSTGVSTARKGIRLDGGEKQRNDGDLSTAFSDTSTNTMKNSNTLSTKPSTSTTSLPLSSSSSASALATTPAQASASTERRAQNEAFFARKGVENAQRPDNLPPSQGGKYVGFGSGGGLGDDDDAGLGAGKRKGIGGPGVDELLQQDPVVTITKGLGWLGNVVGQGVQKISTSNVSTAARQTAAHLSEIVIQPGARTAAESISRFVDPDGPLSSIGGNNGGGPDAEHRDFWERFAASANNIGGLGGTDSRGGTQEPRTYNELDSPNSRRNSISDLLASRDNGIQEPSTAQSKQYNENGAFNDNDDDDDDDDDDDAEFRDAYSSSSTHNMNTTSNDTSTNPTPSEPATATATATAQQVRRTGMRLTPSTNKSKPQSGLTNVQKKKNNNNNNNNNNNTNPNASMSSSLSSLPPKQAPSQPTSLLSSSSSTNVSRSASLKMGGGGNSSSSIGTSAMKKGGAGVAGGTTGTTGAAVGGDEWDDW